jgi:hypothetical protein
MTEIFETISRDARDAAESAFNLAQTKGVCVSRYPSEMEKGMEGISHSIYIPKKAG